MVIRADLSDVTPETADMLAVHIANDRAASAVVALYTDDRQEADRVLASMTKALHGRAVDVYASRAGSSTFSPRVAATAHGAAVAWLRCLPGSRRDRDWLEELVRRPFSRLALTSALALALVGASVTTAYAGDEPVAGSSGTISGPDLTVQPSLPGAGCGTLGLLTGTELNDAGGVSTFEEGSDPAEEPFDPALQVPGECAGSEQSAPGTMSPAAEVGLFMTKGDYMHVTRGEASGHGWWEKGTTKATKADVTIWIQAKVNGKWVTKASNKRTIGPGTSKRANARFLCKSGASTSWRSIVDVDLVGQIDSPERLTTPARTIPCGVTA